MAARGGLAPARVTVLGDVNLELTSRVGIPFDNIRENRLIYAPLDVVVGGTGANFAIAAKSHFATVRLVGVVGADRQGDWAHASLRAAGVEPRLYRDPNRPTGMVVAIRDGGRPLSTRLMIVSSGNANHAFTLAHLAMHADCFEQTDLLVADGYSLLAEPRRSTVLEAMRRAAGGGAHVAIDLVPHHVDRLIDSAELGIWLAHVSVVVTEVGTLSRLLGLTAPAEPGLTCAMTATHRLGTLYPGRTHLLRFGTDNIAHSLIHRPDHPPTHVPTGYTTTDSHGFGDRLTAFELARYVLGAPGEQMTR